MSLADLCLLLLGFFVILYTGKADIHEVARATRGAFGSEETDDVLVVEAPADLFFEEGEARLTRDGRSRFAAIGRRAAILGRRVQIESVGKSADAVRFDGWELSAARAAAVARVVKEGGVPAEHIEISMPPERRSPPPPPGQQITVIAR
ncbi:OmpA family protein [Allosphingosinicella flava]|uniref:OmpA family protein n=2 Tax=Allosphingosinicella flava TaxID=2771430 RepID=A0A7T2GK44_9SPHN|nr:OmpA family protein [Sphingosinicella flava]